MNRKGIKKWKSKNNKILQLQLKLDFAKARAKANENNYIFEVKDHNSTKRVLQAFKNFTQTVYGSAKIGSSLKVSIDDFRYIIEALPELGIEHRISRADCEDNLIEIKSPVEISHEESLNRFQRQAHMNFRC
jgi:hypothetical protein